MDIFGMGIETFALTAVGWLAIEFVKFSWNRGTSRKVAAVELQPKPVPLADGVVPFKRPQPKLTDRDLIQFAKSVKFPGSKNWRFNRRLSDKVRQELMQLKAG